MSDEPAPELASAINLHQNEAEQLFAASTLLNEETAREACGWLEPSLIRNEKISVFWKRVKAGEDAATVAMDIGAYFEFMTYLNRVGSVYEVDAFARTIATDSYLTQSAHVMPDMARAIYERKIDELKALAQGIVESSPSVGDTIPTLAEIGLEFQTMLDNVEDQSEKTGLRPLDDATGGLEKGTMTLVAARPSMGKSSLAIQLCRYKAEAEHKRPCLFSLEMKRHGIFQRMALGDLRMSWRDVRAGKASEAQLDAIRNKAADLIDSMGDCFYIDDRAGQSIEDIWRKVAQYRFDLVVIDHLGLISTKEKDDVKALGQISWGGKMIAKQFNIPVVMLYQLNRDTEKRDNKRPVMSDIRGSGRIEENADNILFLYRPDYYEDSSVQEKAVVSDAEIIIAKFREGTRNIQVKTKYHLDEQKFYSIRYDKGEAQ